MKSHKKNLVLEKRIEGRLIKYAIVNGKKYIYPKTFIQDLGLYWRSARKRITNEDRWKYIELEMKTNSGTQRGIFIPEDKFTGFMYTINVNKASDEAKQKLIEWQDKITPLLHKLDSDGYAIDHDRAENNPEIYDKINTELFICGNSLNWLSHLEKRLKESFAEICSDYSYQKEAVIDYCKKLSNKICVATTGLTISEIKQDRCSHQKEYCGVNPVRVKKINLRYLQVAKNYFSNKEITDGCFVTGSMYRRVTFWKQKGEKITCKKLIDAYEYDFDFYSSNYRGGRDESSPESAHAKRHVKSEYHVYKNLPIKPENKNQGFFSELFTEKSLIEAHSIEYKIR